MKKRMIFFGTALASLMLVLAAVFAVIPAIGADDAPTVLLDGKTAAFTFRNVADPARPDLFPDLKNVMPGDTLRETIVVGVSDFKDLETSMVTIGLAVGEENGDFQKLLASEDVRVALRVDGEKAESDDLRRGMTLKTFTGDETVTVDVILSVDRNAGNEIAALAAAVDWRFYALKGPLLDDSDHIAYVRGYPDGTVGPERNITRAEAAAIFYRLLLADCRDADLPRRDFSDVTKGSWYEPSVRTLAAAGILAGYPDGSFRPNQSITRAEMAAMVSRFESAAERSVSAPRFSDLKGHWAAKQIEAAAGRGWVSGYPDGTFRPNRRITRAEAMTLVNNVLGRFVDETGLAVLTKSPGFRPWPDNPSSAWYYCAVMEATHSHTYERSDREGKNGFYENWILVKE